MCESVGVCEYVCVIGVVERLIRGVMVMNRTGYVLQPFELLYRQAVEEGIKCWAVLTKCLCRQRVRDRCDSPTAAMVYCDEILCRVFVTP